MSGASENPAVTSVCACVHEGCVLRRYGSVCAAVSVPAEAAAAPAARTHAVGSSAAEQSGAPAAGRPTAAPAVPGETQAALPAASHQQGIRLHPFPTMTDLMFSIMSAIRFALKKKKISWTPNILYGY